jgi:hypothetical protein
MALSMLSSKACAIATVRSRLCLSSHPRRSFSAVATGATSRVMAKVGVVQMTSTNDLEANFQTCSRLVKAIQISLKYFHYIIIFLFLFGTTYTSWVAVYSGW